jgi:hypothetical protein
MARIARVVVLDFPHHVVQRGARRMDVFSSALMSGATGSGFFYSSQSLMFRGRRVFSQKKDEARLEILGLRDESLEESNNLSDVLAQEIVEDLEAALEQFRESSRI